MIKRFIALVAAALLLPAGAALAQNCTITGLNITPSNPSTGQKLSLTVNGTKKANFTTQLLYSLDNGPAAPLAGASSFPVVAEVPGFTTGGTHAIKVWSTNSSGHPDTCSGQATTAVNVTQPIAVGAGPVMPVALPMNPCPSGWDVVPGSKTPAGGYTCKPKQPAPFSCPPKHQYAFDGCKASCQQMIY